MPNSVSVPDVWAKPPAWSRWLLVVILLVAAVLRLYQVGRLPPGLMYDEAAYGLDASRVLAAGDIRPFYEENNGREPLFIFLEALSISVLGHTALALRLTATLIGLVTLPFHYRLTLSLFSGERHAASVALLSTATLAVIYWHVHFSRLGMRTILMPLAALLVMGSFWRAWRTERLRLYVLAGGLLGLSLYTYLAARLLPFALLAFIGIEALLGWRRARRANDVAARLRRRLMGLALLGSAALVVAAPLLAYLLQQPESLSSRTQDVSVFTANQGEMPGTPAERLLKNTVLVLRLFYDQGDLNASHNLPGRPAFDPPMLALFVVGVGVALVRLRHPLYRLLGLWLGAMLLNTWLSIEAPHMLRSLGAVPVVCILVGMGGSAALAWLAARTRRDAARWPAALALIILLVSGLLTARDYFVLWPQHPRVSTNFSVRQTEISRALLAAPDDTDVIVPISIFAHPSLRYLVAARYPQLGIAPPGVAVADLPAPRLLTISPNAPDEPLVLLRPGPMPQAFLLQTMSQPQQAAFGELLGAAWDEAQPLLDHNGAMVAFAVTLTPPMAALLPQPSRPTHLLSRHFADGLELVAYDVQPPTVAPGRSFYVTLFWRGEERWTRRPRLFVHLLDKQEGVWSNGSPVSLGAAYLVTAWPVGEWVFDVYALDVPDAMPPRKARVEIGVLDPRTGNRLQVYDASGNPAGDRVLLGAVAVTGADLGETLTAALPAQAQFGEEMALRGYTLQGEAQPGGTLNLQLLWEALKWMPRDNQVFVHLVDGQGQMVAQHDHPAGTEANPTGWWLPGERVADPYVLNIPRGASPGPYVLRVGVYELPGGNRLPVAGPQAHPDGYVSLAVE